MACTFLFTFEFFTFVYGSNEARLHFRRYWDSTVDKKCATEVSSDRHEVGHSEVVASEWSMVVSTERAFHGEDVRHGALELLVDCDTGSRLLGLLHAEARVLEGEEG